ncbi:MAG: TRAP transporter TatT component family protein [Deltaproteobacteria bacterium]|nr:TRAP transporter TatT component family protein [Deltaproteobacteria bacterium]
MKLTCCLKILGCIALSLLSATAGLGAATGSLAEADGLLNSPALSMTQAARALSLSQGLLATAGAPRALVLAHLGRTCFVLGQLAPDPQGMGYYQQGQSYAETLIREEPNRVEGHYWLAINLCGQADVGGNFLGRKLLPRILEELKRAVALDETYDQAGAHRVLGRIYYEAPGWPLSVGDLQKSRQHLQAAVRLAPATSANHLYLAQTLLRLNEAGLARQELEQVLKSTRGAVKPQDLEEDRQEARRLLAEIKDGEAR